MKRKDYISWDNFFIGVAELASKRSKDPNTRNGCCIIDPHTHNILSIGYNGLPRGLNDNGFDVRMTDSISLCPKEGLHYDYWGKPQKYEFVVHAEENAMFNATVPLDGTILYLYSDKGYYPCSRCARGILQNGIKEVVLKTVINKDTKQYNWDYTKHMFGSVGIKIRILENEKNSN